MDIKDFPVAPVLLSEDVIAAQRPSTGAPLGVKLSALGDSLAPMVPVNIVATLATISVGPMARLKRDGSPVNFAGGTIASPTVAGTTWLVLTTAGALALRSTFVTSATDDLVLAAVVATGSPVTAITVYRPAARGGDMMAANNLGDLTNIATARNNLGVGFLYQQGSTISGAGNTELAVADANTDGVVRYAVSAGAAAYTRTVSISASNAPNGTKLTILLDLPAAPINSPTIEIRSGSGGSGTLITTVLSGPFARTERIELVYNPTTWILVSSGPEPHAGAQQLAEVIENQTPNGAIRFDGAVGKYAESVIRGITLGTNDYTAAVTFRCGPNSEGANTAVFTVGGGAGGAGGNGEIGLLAYQNSGNFSVLQRDASGAIGGNTLVLAQFYGRTIQLALVRRAGVLTVFVDGQQVSYTPNTANAVLPVGSGSDTVVRIGGLSSTGASYRERIHAFQLFNRALTSAELRMLAVRGVATEDRNAMGPIISHVGGQLNGGFETPGGGGADNFALWNESASGSSTINRDTSIFAEGSASCRMDIDASNSVAAISQSLVEPVKNYRVSGKLRTNRTTGSNFIQYNLNFPTDSQYTLPATAPQNVWTDFSFEMTSGNALATGLGAFRLGRTISEDTGLSRWFDAIVLERIGCLVDLDLGAGSGFSLPDLQGRYPVVIAPGSYSNFIHSRPQRRGQFVVSVSATGNTQIPGLPNNARISGIICEIGNSQTIAIGNASGGGQIVSSIALTAGKNELTLVSRYTTTQNLWVSLSSAIPTALTFLYDLVS